jgi:4-hydroxy-3-methylbut-2-enyl diphosphate reductase IspH
MVSEVSDLENISLDHTKKMGICGATSTPMWQMEQVEKKLREMSEKHSQ